MAKKLLVKQVKRKIGTQPKQRATLIAWGVRKNNSEGLHDETAVIRGMIDKVSHLVSVKVITE